jgi:hypothetical protein
MTNQALKKIADNIRGFTADLIKLEGLIRDRLEA